MKALSLIFVMSFGLCLAGANDNPDGEPAATVTYFSRDYDTQVSADVISDPGICLMQWGANYGYGGSGGWRAVPDPGGGEDNAGYLMGTGVAPVDAVHKFMVSYMFYMSPELLQAITDRPGGFWAHANKILDVRQYLPDGSGLHGAGNQNTRWNVHVKHFIGGGGVKFSHVPGGGGSQYIGGSENLPFSAFNGWVWVAHMYDGPNARMRTYIKRPGDPDVIRILERTSDIIGGSGAEIDYLYYNGRGFGLGERTLWGYWDDMLGIPYDPNKYLVVDRLRVTNGWVNPPSDLSPELTPLQAWKQSYFGNPNAPDTDDNDGDGINSLLEYAIGTDPLVPSLLPSVTSHNYGADGTRLRVIFPRDPAKNDITILIEATSDLDGSWQTIASSSNGAVTTGPGYVGGDGAGPGIKQVEVRDTVSSAAASKRFIRIRIVTS
jgi:hypothetical protein